MRLQGKIGIVTAAGSGMGRAGALRFAREGARVAVVDVAADRVEQVVGEIAAAGGVAHGIVADLPRDEERAASSGRPATASGRSTSSGITWAIPAPPRWKASTCRRSNSLST